MSDAKRILESIIDEYSVEKFGRFFREKSHQFAPRQEAYSRYDDDNFANGLKIGEVNFSEIDSLLICTFEVTKALSERAGKKAQYDKAKSILKSAENQKYSAGIFIFYDRSGNFRFSLVYPESIGTKRQWNNFRRFTYFVSGEFTNKTFLKQIGEKEFSKLDDIKAAFSITAVTNLFYDEFFKIYDKIVDETKRINNITEEDKARDFVLLFAIRTIFLGFIQKKKWLGEDEKFIQSFYQEYKEKLPDKNEFYTRWLTPLFFEALNSPQGGKVVYGNNDFSADTETKLQMAPYLNGGLFRQKQGYDTNGWMLSDQAIEAFFDFLFSHSFTIEENSLEDEDLQLNPEFLGIIFERLVNKADGAVYTPRPEVDLMCRLSLVKWLQKNLETTIRAENIYELFFKESEKEEEQKQGSFSQKEAQEILDKLENLAICDPAVGSGAFLVGMMQVLDSVEQSLRSRYGLDGKSLFERKKQIIKSSLYGVEVKEWAVWICQLRLWLSLFVDAPDDLKNSFEAILPNLDFKVRKGDSLVQIIGSRNVPVSADKSLVTGNLLKQVRELIQLKTAHYESGRPSKEEIEHREFIFYRNWLEKEIHEEQRKLVQYNTNEQDRKNQQSLFDESMVPVHKNLDLFTKEREETVDKLEQLRTQLRDLHQTNKPFLWQLEFSEIFSTKGGFDIVIGNPPYVRQESIADPTGKIKDKKKYKGYLQEMVKLDFPDYFPPKAKINAQSDLYTYFYIRALRLLNPQGIHTFICSNSWLDVGYGVWLQEFLLNRCPVEIIIDNHAKRSFEAADVNTIISIIHAPQKSVKTDHLVKFVAFKKPFESAIFTENLIAIDQAKEVETNDIYRVYPISITNLKEAGMEHDDEAQTTMKMGKYVGDKWGGKYLRAPDIFFTILEKGKDNLLKLGEVSEVNEGRPTGANNFFFLNYDIARAFKIETQFLSNAVMQTKNKSYEILNAPFVDRKLLLLPQNMELFAKLNVAKYIKKGQKEILPYSRTLKAKRFWWYIPQRKPSDIVSPCGFGDKFYCAFNPEKALTSNSYAEVRVNDKKYLNDIHRTINSPWGWLQLELLGRQSLGGGMLKTDPIEFRKLLFVKNLNTRKYLDRKIRSVFDESGIDPKSETPIEEQDPKPLPDRAELDNIVFDTLKLSEDERKDVYRAVCRLVWNRINKANSV